MLGIGTLVNVIGIIAGGVIGLLGKKLISKRIQDSLTKATGLSVIFIGIGGAMSKLLYIHDNSLDTQGSIMLILSFAIGSLLGELLNIEKRFEDFGEYLKKKSGSEGDAGFVPAFLTASFTVCIGAMAIVGAIQEGMLHDATTLYTKALLDFLIIAVMSTSLGKGCLFSAIPVGIWQFSITLFSSFLAPFMTEAALNNIGLTGSILIFCVGVNLIDSPRFRVANMLPTILISVLMGLYLPS